MKAYRFLMMLVILNALMAQTFPKSLVLVDYFYHTDVYAGYCLNKDNPQMHCNGMCQLDKKMENMNHHHSDSSRRVEITFSNYLPAEPLSIKMEVPALMQNILFFFQQPYIPENWIEKPLQPPRFLV